MPPTCRSRTAYPGAPDQLDRDDGARTLAAAARRPGARQARPSPQVRRARAAQPRHRAAGHEIRLDARVVRAEQHGDAPRPGLDGAALSRRRDDPLRGRRRQGREAVAVQRGADRDRGRVLRRGCRRRAAPAPCAVAADRAAADAASPLRGNRAAAGARAARHGAPRRADRHGDAEEAEPRTREEAGRARGAGACRRPARHSTSIRRSSCRKCCSASWGCPCSARRRPASPRPRRTCSRNSRTTTSCRASSSTTAAWRNSGPPTRTSCPGRWIPAPGACTPRITRRSRRPDACRRPTRTCRTSRSARRKAGASARPSSRRRATC